jgi:hypothetical protein
MRATAGRKCCGGIRPLLRRPPANPVSNGPSGLAFRTQWVPADIAASRPSGFFSSPPRRSQARRLSPVRSGATPPAGVRVLSRRSGLQEWALGRRGCLTQVYLDGVSFLYDPPDLNSFPASSLAGVEMYRSTAQIPGEFGEPRETCGVLLLWSRKDP